MKIRKIAQKTGVVAIKTTIILIISLLLTEMSFRIYNHFQPTFIFYSDSYNRFRGKPFAANWNFKLNSYGFKDEEFADKKEDVYRILGIGDSFAFGVVPYENNYLTLVESQLQLESINVEVFNMGIPCIGPKDYMTLLINEGLSFQPDMVLLSFFVGNDFYESKTPKYFEYSYVISFFHYILNLRPKYKGTSYRGKGEYCDDCPTFDKEKFLNIEHDRAFIYLLDNKRFYKKLENTLHYLNQIKSICNKQDIKLVVAILPDELQINQKLRRNIKKLYYPNLKKSNWDITFPNRMLSNKLDISGIDNIDLYEYFADTLNKRLYKPRDTHWNIAGNQLAANIIQKYLREYLENDDDNN